MKQINVAVYGTNGHQIHKLLENHPRARLVATAAFNRDALGDGHKKDKSIKHYDTLDEALADRRVELVSLCSPRRADQAGDALKCLSAGRHVYAEKPCVTEEKDLDRLLAAAEAGPARFREMAGTAFEQPYLAMRDIVRSGRLGTVVQVFAQKSYPYGDWRPQDEAVDGGLTCQCGVHAMRFIEHVAGLRVTDVEAMETRLGNPRDGDLRMASSIMMRLANGGVASIVANYLNPHGFGSWGNEHLRIFGTQGILEAVDGGKRTRLVLGERDLGPIDTSAPSMDYFSMYADSLLGHGEMPLSLEEELHPTRMVLRARDYARALAEARAWA